MLLPPTQFLNGSSSKFGNHYGLPVTSNGVIYNLISPYWHLRPWRVLWWPGVFVNSYCRVCQNLSRRPVIGPVVSGQVFTCFTRTKPEIFWFVFVDLLTASLWYLQKILTNLSLNTSVVKIKCRSVSDDEYCVKRKLNAAKAKLNTDYYCYLKKKKVYMAYAIF